MMSFRVIKSGLETILDNAVNTGGIYAGKFRVIKYQKEMQSSEEVNGNNRTVQVYYSSGDFSGSPQRISKHDMTFNLEMTAGSSGKVDLTGLDSATTDAQRAAILGNYKEALYQADQNLDELIEMVFQVVMAGDNIRLGVNETTTGVKVNTRMIPRVQKNDPTSLGEYVVISAVMSVTCESSENLISTTETDGETINTIFKFKDDDEGKAALDNDITT